MTCLPTNTSLILLSGKQRAGLVSRRPGAHLRNKPQQQRHHKLGCQIVCSLIERVLCEIDCWMMSLRGFCCCLLLMRAMKTEAEAQADRPVECALRRSFAFNRCKRQTNHKTIQNSATQHKNTYVCRTRRRFSCRRRRIL